MSEMELEVKGAVMATSPAVHSEQKRGETVLREALGDEAESLIANRKKRDGSKAHITLINPPDARKAIALLAEKDGSSKSAAEKKFKELAKENVAGDFKVLGVGKVERGSDVAYYAALDWPAGRAFRESLGIDPDGQDFHITLGFGDSGDVTGVSKKLTSSNRLKASTLRSKVIRLAHQKPELRSHLLPLLAHKGIV